MDTRPEYNFCGWAKIQRRAKCETQDKVLAVVSDGALYIDFKLGVLCGYIAFVNSVQVLHPLRRLTALFF